VGLGQPVEFVFSLLILFFTFYLFSFSNNFVIINFFWYFVILLPYGDLMEKAYFQQGLQVNVVCTPHLTQ
jgi:hypothetical protein